MTTIKVKDIEVKSISPVNHDEFGDISVYHIVSPNYVGMYYSGIIPGTFKHFKRNEYGGILGNRSCGFFGQGWIREAECFVSFFENGSLEFCSCGCMYKVYNYDAMLLFEELPLVE